MPYILLVETMSTGHMIPRLPGKARLVTNVLLFGLALVAAVYGVTYAYLLHQLVNGLAAWLVIVHFCADGWMGLARGGDKDKDKVGKDP